MRVVWNSYEPPVPLDIANDELDFIVELNRADGAQVTVKSTQISTSGEVLIKVNGRRSSEVLPEPLAIANYSIRILSYELDHIPSHEIAIISHELKGKSLRIKVDAACQ